MRQVHRAGEKLFVDYSGKKPRIVDRRRARSSRSSCSSRCSARRTTPTPRRRARSAVPTSSRSHVRALRLLRRRARRARPRPAQERRDARVPLRAGHPAHLRGDGAALRHDGPAGAARHSRATRRRSRSACRSRSAGSWRGCATRPSSRSASSTRASRSCSTSSTTGGCASTARAGASSSSASTGRRSGRCPTERFVYGEWKTARVNIDYHVEVDDHYYSVPHALVHEERRGARDGDDGRDLLQQRGASRRTRAATRAAEHTTDPGAHAEVRTRSTWSGRRRASSHWASTIGPTTARARRRRSSPSGRTPSRATARASGILRLAKRYGARAARGRVRARARRRRALVPARRRRS